MKVLHILVVEALNVLLQDAVQKVPILHAGVEPVGDNLVLHALNLCFVHKVSSVFFACSGHCLVLSSVQYSARLLTPSVS